MYVKTTSRKIKTAAKSATCTWPTTSGTPPPAGQCRRSCTVSAAKTRWTRDAIRRLVASLSRLLDPADALAATAGGDLVFTESRPLRRRVRAGRAVAPAGHRDDPGRARGIGARPAAGRRRRERVLFALVANRALAPSSKLAAAEWMSQDVHIDGLAAVSDDACYRAMDWLHAVRGELEKQIFYQVADLLNLEVDLLFFDTTSTYFELEEADEEAAAGLARREDLPTSRTPTRTRPPGSAPTASPRTAAMTCRRS